MIKRWLFHIQHRHAARPRSPAGVLRTDTLEIIILRSREIDPLDGWGDEAAIEAVQKALADDDVIARVQIIESSADLAEWQPGTDRTIVFPNSRRISFSDPLVEPLAARGIAMVGGGSSSVYAQDKLFMKRTLSSRRLPTPAWIVSGPGVSARSVVKNLGLPLIVKPVVGAESAGVIRCDSEESLESVIEHPGLLVEEWCRYREFTVGVLGNGPERIAAPLEIVLPGADAILDAKAKAAGVRDAIRVARFDPKASAATRLALAACEALNIADLARIDVVVDKAGLPYVIDVNASPGLRYEEQHPSIYPLCFTLNAESTYDDVIRAVVASAAIRCGIEPPSSLQLSFSSLTAKLK
jgi:D-alanine-D-alanine ligase